jgi:hypothetical protein
LKVTDKNRRIQSQICLSEVRTRGSGSVPKCHRSGNHCLLCNLFLTRSSLKVGTGLELPTSGYFFGTLRRMRMRRRRRLAGVVLMICGILRMSASRRGDNRRLLGRQGQATTDKGHHFRHKIQFVQFLSTILSVFSLQDYEVKFMTSECTTGALGT